MDWIQVAENRTAIGCWGCDNEPSDSMGGFGTLVYHEANFYYAMT
jgi:hypothetical protein